MIDYLIFQMKIEKLLSFDNSINLIYLMKLNFNKY